MTDSAPAELRDPAWRVRILEALDSFVLEHDSITREPTIQDRAADWVWARLQAQAAADQAPPPPWVPPQNQYLLDPHHYVSGSTL
jgi:hypothetical protein